MSKLTKEQRKRKNQQDRERRARNKAKSAAASAKSVSKSNGDAIVHPAPKNGPNLTLRMRSKAHIGRVHKAAKRAGMSMNTWAVEVLGLAAEAQIT